MGHFVHCHPMISKASDEGGYCFSTTIQQRRDTDFSVRYLELDNSLLTFRNDQEDTGQLASYRS